MDVASRNNIVVTGSDDAQPILFAHGFGCDQNMWRYVAPAFEDAYRVVLFDHVGAGGSDLSRVRPRSDTRTLDGYADDVLEIVDELEPARRDLRRPLGQRDDRRARGRRASRSGSPTSCWSGPSPRYINDDGYVGGFAREDIDELLESLDSNYLGWSSAMAPVIMGNADRPELGEELTNSFCRTDPAMARALRPRHVPLRQPRRPRRCVAPPTLVLQCSDDVIAPDGRRRLRPRARSPAARSCGWTRPATVRT